MNFSFDITMLFDNNKFNEIGIYFGQCTEVYVKIIRKVEIILEII
jgi:hypothetical protein